jgi:putative ABC transport system permease protein
MLKNFFISTIRNLWKNKGVSILNSAGLALGLASFLLVILFVIDEVRYDRHNVDYNRIFRVNTELKYGGAVNAFAVAAPPLGQALADNFPEVEKAARLMPLRNVRFKKGTETVREDKVFYADPELFDIFTLPVIEGDPLSALTAPGGIVLTETAARKYFNSTDVVGKTLIPADNGTPLTVGAVIRDMPQQSHFHADFFLSLASNASARNTNFNAFTFHTYVLLKPGANEKALEAKFPPFLRKHLSNNMNMDAFEKGGNYIRIGLTPLKEIHLHSNRQKELEANSDIQYVYIFSAVAILILFLAVINFMNLSTARSANRAREVGVRKVLGSLRQSLIVQFLSESILITLLSIMTACLIAWMLLPFFNQMAGKNITITAEDLAWLIPVLCGLTIAVGILAGFYPAFFLSRFRPIDVLKGKLSIGFKGRNLRNVLVVFQFSISTFLIIGTLVIYNQLSYIRNKDVGFEREQVLVIKYASVLENSLAFKEEVKRLSGVVNASLSGYLPTGGSRWSNGISTGDRRGLLTECWLVDADYVPTFAMTMIKGRNFSEKLATDSSAIIVNQTAAQMLGYANEPLNEMVRLGTGPRAKDFNIIGMVKDFNFNSLRDNVTPLVMILGSDWSASLNVRVQGGQTSAVLEQIKRKWRQLMPDQEFDFSFMDHDFEAIYKTEQRMENLFMIFAFLAILIGCLGLFGLSAYATEQRTKEMSIRQILGATIRNLVATLSLDFIKPVLIAIVISIPLAWLAMEQWLQTFAYREGIPVWSFLLAGFGTVLIAMATISFQCIKAAIVNPSETLRHE